MVFSGPPEAAASLLLVSEMSISSQLGQPLPNWLSLALTQELTVSQASEEAPRWVPWSTLELCMQGGGRARGRSDAAGMRQGAWGTGPG